MTSGPAPTSESARTGILVLGMHRSGTSALARVLGLLGAALPRDLNNTGAGAAADHWEPLPVVQLDDAILAEAGSAWDDWRAVATEACSPSSVERIAGVLADQFGEAPLFVLKDPRISRLVPLYRAALASMVVAPRVVLSLRNPLAVARSLEVRDGRPAASPSCCGCAMCSTRSAQAATCRARSSPTNAWSRIGGRWSPGCPPRSA